MNCYNMLFSLKDNQPIMAVDFGSKRIGVAFSDKKRQFAFPHSVILRKTSVVDDLEQVYALYKHYDCVLLVIGMPYDHVRQDGWLDKIRSFAEALQRDYCVPIYFQDESYSTSNSSIVASGFSKNSKKKLVDKLAASYILEQALGVIRFYSASDFA